MYTFAGSELFTSGRILADEQRLVATACRTDGPVVEAETVELALLEAAANGNALDAGQALWCVPCAPPGRGCSSPSRVRPREDHRDAYPGSGMERRRGPSAPVSPVRAPSNAAPGRHQCTRRDVGETDLVHYHNDLPDWAECIGRSTLVIIDEAGMADTLSLDAAVQFIVGRGGSVRLVGDDQQLAAIGVGGVLRKPAMARPYRANRTA